MQEETVDGCAIGGTCLNPAYGGKQFIFAYAKAHNHYKYGSSVSVTQGFTERGQLQ